MKTVHVPTRCRDPEKFALGWDFYDKGIRRELAAYENGERSDTTEIAVLMRAALIMLQDHLEVRR